MTKEGPHRDPSFFCKFYLFNTFATTHHPCPGSLPAREAVGTTVSQRLRSPADTTPDRS